MRGNSLGAMVQMLRRELGIAESPALGRNTRQAHVQALQVAQQRLYQAHDWPYKKIQRDKAMVAGERYYQVPTDLDLENIRKVEVRWTNLWQPCVRGISAIEYNMINSDADVRQDYVRRWDLYNDPDTNGDMFEVWPIPATATASLLRFYGIKKLSPFVMDADKADVDDWAVVLSAAADLAPIKVRGIAQTKADKYVFSLARNLASDATFISGGGCDPNSERYRPPPVIISQ